MPLAFKTLIITAALAAVALLLGVSQSQQVDHPAAPTFYLGGIQINESDQNAWSSTLKKNQFNTLQVTVYANQGPWNTAQLAAPTDVDGTVQKIRAAKAQGLHVALILRVQLDHAYPENRFLWHGLILPEGSAALDAWFDRYTKYIVDWAAIAQQEGVAILGIGSEMNALAATQPLDALPNLEAYYLDQDAQDQRREALLAEAHRIPPQLIYAPGDQAPKENLRQFMTEKAQRLATWAATTTYRPPSSPEKTSPAVDTSAAGSTPGAGPGLDPDPQVLQINQRRAHKLRRWRQLIAQARAVYDGQLTYAANFDNFADVAFWPELDIMGVNAYFPLRDPGEPADVPTLAQGWREAWDDIDLARQRANKPYMPVMFTELGYTRRANCTIAPWAWEGFDLIGPDKDLFVWAIQPIDELERARSIQALHQVQTERGHPLVGLLYWKLTSTPRHHAIEPFSLLLKPADFAAADLAPSPREPGQQEPGHRDPGPQEPGPRDPQDPGQRAADEQAPFGPADFPHDPLHDALRKFARP